MVVVVVAVVVVVVVVVVGWWGKVEDIEILVVLKKEHVGIPEFNQKRSRGVFKKNSCGISQGLSF